MTYLRVMHSSLSGGLAATDLVTWAKPIGFTLRSWF